MPRRIWFGEDYWDFNDDASQDEIDAIGNDWMRFGNLDAVRQKFAIEGLATNPDFLSLPFTERTAAFSGYAKDGPYWQMLKPDERRAIRDSITNAEGASEAETYNYWQAPFSYGGNNLLDKIGVFEEEHQNLLTSALDTGADIVRAAQTGGSDLLANLWAGVTTQISTAAQAPRAGYEAALGAAESMLGERAPAKDPDSIHSYAKNRAYTRELYPGRDTPWLERAAGELADRARETQMDASIGRDLIAAPTKYESFKEAREEGGFAGYLRHGITTAAGQAPQVGLTVASAIVNPLIAAEAMMSMETGGALDQMAQEGVEMGFDAELAAVTAGAINGVLELIPISKLLNRIPGFKEPFKKAIWKHATEVLKQGGIEALTEFPQNIVTDAAVDVVNENRGDIDKVRWRTPEGRAETIGDAWEAGQAGGFTGTIMALFGVGGAQMQRRFEGAPPTGEEMAAQRAEAEEAAQPSPDLQAAREILRRLQGDQGPAVPEMGGMEPTYPGQGPPADAVPGVVAPPGSVDAAGDTLPLVGGPGGATTWEQGQWSELDEQKARFNYAPEWMRVNEELTDAFARGDIDEDTLNEMEALAMAAGLDPMQARADILERRDQAIAFLRGDMMQEETGDFGVLETEDVGDFTPSQRGQRTLEEAIGPGPAAPGPAPISPEPVAPTQPRGVEGGPMRLGEGQQVEPEVEAAWREGGAERTAVTPPEGEPGEGAPGAPAAPAAPPTAPPAPAVPPTREETGRRAAPRGREVDAVVSRMFELQRSGQFNPELVGRLITRIQAGDDVMALFQEDAELSEGLHGEIVETALDLEEAVATRQREERVAGELQAEAMGEEAVVVDEGPPPEATGAELEALVKGPGEVEAGIKVEAVPANVKNIRKAFRKFKGVSKDFNRFFPHKLYIEIGDNLVDINETDLPKNGKLRIYSENVKRSPKDPEGSLDDVFDVVIEDGEIVEIGEFIEEGAAIKPAEELEEQALKTSLSQKNDAYRNAIKRLRNQKLPDHLVEKYEAERDTLEKEIDDIRASLAKAVGPEKIGEPGGPKPEAEPVDEVASALSRAQRLQRVWEIKNVEASPEEKQAHYDSILAKEIEAAEAPIETPKVRKFEEAKKEAKPKTAEEVETSPEVGDRFMRDDGMTAEVIGTRTKKDGTVLFRLKFKDGHEHSFTHAALKSIRYNALATGEEAWVRPKIGQSIHQFVLEEGGIKGFTDKAMSEELFGDKGREGIPVRLRGKIFVDEMLELAIRAGHLPPGSEIHDLVDALKEPDLSLEEIALQQIEALEAEEGPDEEPPFDLSKPTPIKPVQVGDMRKGFPGWAVRKVTPTVYRLTRKGQPIVHVAVVNRAPTEAEIKKAAKAHGLPVEEVKAAIAAGELVVKGSYTMNEITGAHLVTLFSPEAGPDTVFEEGFHFAFHNVLNASQRQLLLKEHETEEGAAAAYKEFKSKGAIQRIFEAIKNFAKNLLGMNNVDVAAAGALMKKIASGKIYEQEGRYFTAMDLGGARPLAVFENTILNAEEAAKEKGKLKASEFGQAVDDAAKEFGHSLVYRGDNTMFSLEAPADVPLGHHPAQILPEATNDERIREKAKKIIYDKLGPILTIQEKLTGIGESVNSMFNAYQKAVNFQSRAGALLDWVNDNLFTPFLDEVATSGIKLPDFDRFRMSAHALERNLKLYGTHVTIPIQIAEAKIKSLKKKMITTGAKVRDLKFGNKGTVKKVFKESGRAEVEFVNPKNPYARKIVSVEMKNIELESLARAKDDIAEIRRMEAAGEVPHSGVSNEDAKATLEEMKALGLVSWTGDLGPTTDYTGLMGNLSRSFSAIVRWKEQTLYKAGLLSKEELALWREYKHYAPMRGKDPDILDVINGGRRTAIPDIEAYGGSMWNRATHRLAKALGIEGTIFSSGAGRGFNPGRGAASHRALGRRSFPAHSPTAELMTDAMQAAVRAERNRVGKVVWNLVNKLRDVRDVKGEKLFEIDTPDTRLVFDEKTGTVKSRVDGLSVTKDNVYSVWIDGKLHYIRHVSPDMAEFVSALNNLGNNKDLHVILKGSSAINRYISKMATSLNPGFTIPNAFRDAITSGIKLAGEAKFKDFGLKTMKRIPKSWWTLSQYARLQSKGRLDEMDAASRARVEAFKLAGGETAFWMIPDLELQMKRLQKTLKKAKGDENVVLTGSKSVISFIEDYNAAVENTMRFAVFERGIDIGLSKDQAATLARDITVDFTKQGTAARGLGGLWVFANAGIQGSANMFKAVAKNKPIRRIVEAGVAYAFMHATLMRYWGGEDPEDGIAYWDKVPWYEKSRNLIFMIPGTAGKRIRIPLPWGYNVFTAIGFAAADVVSGPKTAWEGTMNVLSTAMSAFNPIGDNDLTTLSGWVQMAMPSPLDPIIDIALNQNFWGGPIKPEASRYKKSEQYGEASPNYNRYFSSVSEPSKAITRLLYKYAGIDVSPEDLDYGIAAVFGGLGDTVNRALSVVGKTAQRESLVARDIPILKSFYGDESQFFAPQMYRENMSDFWLKKEQFDYLKKEDPKSANEFYKRHREILGYESMVKATEKRIREMKKNGVRVTDSRMQREFKQFNRRFNTLETRTMKRRIRERK